MDSTLKGVLEIALGVTVGLLVYGLVTSLMGSKSQ
jgi:hypothetical protein